MVLVHDPRATTETEPGYWEARSPTGASGGGAGGSIQVTNVSFSVPVDQATVSGFGFAWDYSGPGKPPSLRARVRG